MLWIFIISVLVGQARLNVIKRDVTSFLTREKCIDGLGCFNAGAPFFNLMERPLSLLPDDREEINTRFILYTREYAQVPMNFSNLDKSMDYLPRSNFNPGFKTKFIVPGYVSKVAPHWKMPLKDALLVSEPCNVFYVDWSGGDGNLYEQAVANTRVVGAEIAVFIQELQKRTGIKPESVHIIGHSLGSHIAGYAGKRLKNLGRITAMDPAGPYFTNVDPIVRLDKADALFVDAIHTNAAPNRFQGFGLVDSIAHFDFFPNGGHLQPGCQDMGHAILAFLSHPSFAKNADIRVQRFFVNHLIELLPWPARSPDLSPIENTWSMVAQQLTQMTPPAATPDQLWQRVEAFWSAVPQEHIQSLFGSMPRRVAAVISNNGGYSSY